jgi:hypothetical protein
VSNTQDTITGQVRGTTTMTRDRLNRVTQIQQSGVGVTNKRVDMNYEAIFIPVLLGGLAIGVIANMVVPKAALAPTGNDNYQPNPHQELKEAAVEIALSGGVGVGKVAIKKVGQELFEEAAERGAKEALELANRELVKKIDAFAKKYGGRMLSGANQCADNLIGLLPKAKESATEAGQTIKKAADDAGQATGKTSDSAEQAIKKGGGLSKSGQMESRAGQLSDEVAQYHDEYLKAVGNQGDDLSKLAESARKRGVPVSASPNSAGSAAYNPKTNTIQLPPGTKKWEFFEEFLHSKAAKGWRKDEIQSTAERLRQVKNKYGGRAISNVDRVAEEIVVKEWLLKHGKMVGVGPAEQKLLQQQIKKLGTSGIKGGY